MADMANWSKEVSILNLNQNSISAASGQVAKQGRPAASAASWPACNFSVLPIMPLSSNGHLNNHRQRVNQQHSLSFSLRLKNHAESATAKMSFEGRILNQYQKQISAASGQVAKQGRPKASVDSWPACSLSVLPLMPVSSNVHLNNHKQPIKRQQSLSLSLRLKNHAESATLTTGNP